MSNRLWTDRLWDSCPLGAGYVDDRVMEQGNIAPCATEDRTAVANTYASILITSNPPIFIVSHFQQDFQFS
jgi:hypothetical protein